MAKIYALIDVIGCPYALMLTAANVGDVKAAPVLLKRSGRMRYLLADKGYDADRLRRSLRDAGAGPAIPRQRNSNGTIRCGKDRYRSHQLIENVFVPSQRLPPCRHQLRQFRHQPPLRRRNRARSLAQIILNS